MNSPYPFILPPYHCPVYFLPSCQVYIPNPLNLLLRNRPQYKSCFTKYTTQSNLPSPFFYPFKNSPLYTVPFGQVSIPYPSYSPSTKSPSYLKINYLINYIYIFKKTINFTRNQKVF